MDGLVLNFQLAGINNRNFLMRDRETGTFWQQISGRAISGPLQGRTLRLIPSEELTFGLWLAEQPAGTVLRESAADSAMYDSKAMEELLGEVPEPLRAEGLAPREPVVAIELKGVAKAWPLSAITREKLLRDRVGEIPVILVAAPDEQSVRAFIARLPGSGDPPEFYRTPDGTLLDDRAGSRWNFQGCAIAGKLSGQCLERVELIHDFWFAWKRYHPQGVLYRSAR